MNRYNQMAEIIKLMTLETQKVEFSTRQIKHWIDNTTRSDFPRNPKRPPADGEYYQMNYLASLLHNYTKPRKSNQPPTLKRRKLNNIWYYSINTINKKTMTPSDMANEDTTVPHALIAIPLTEEELTLIKVGPVRLDFQPIDPALRTDTSEENDKVYGVRFKAEGAEILSLCFAMKGNPVYCMDIEIDEEGYFKPDTLSINPLFPFFNENDTNEIENVLFKVFFALKDISIVPIAE